MVPVANKPVMEHIIDLLKLHGVKNIGVTLQYMPEIIKAHFGDGSDFGVRLRYFVEETPLGTAGSVKNGERFLNEPFIVISGDALTDIDLTRAVEFHRQKNALVTLVLKKVDIPLEYGVVVTDGEGRITRFLEKPGWGQIFSDTINTGIYILSPVIFNYYERGQFFDFSKDLFPILLKEGAPMYGFVADDYWCDIGDLEAYHRANLDALEGLVRIRMPGRELQRGIWMDESASVDPGARLEAPCIIGSNTVIRSGAFIGGGSVIGDDCLVESRASIKRCQVWQSCCIGKDAQLRGSILCNRVVLKAGVSTFEQSVIGGETIVRENSIIKPNVKIWPDKIIEAGTELNANKIWGSKHLRRVFGNRGVGGEINTDITPEYAARLGAAYGSLLKGKSGIGVSSDGSNAGNLFKSALYAGILSAGHEILDFGELLLPVARSAVRFYHLDGGIHITTDVGAGTRVFIDFLNTNGSNIEQAVERKIEGAFLREDFKRCSGDSIQGIREIKDYGSYYGRSILNRLLSKPLGYRICLRAASMGSRKLTTELLREAGCQVEVPYEESRACHSTGVNHSEDSMAGFARSVRRGGYDLGVAVDSSGEKMTLVDHRGVIITEDMFMALISVILFRKYEGVTAVVPFSASNIIERMAEEYKGKVHRSKTSPQDHMLELLGKEFREDLLEQFTMHFDATACLLNILEYMKISNYSLSELVNLIPEFHMNKGEVDCPWSAKGRVIRRIIQENDETRIETFEGVKINHDRGWALVLPDGERPVCKVICESATEEYARELTDFYIQKVREISRE